MAEGSLNGRRESMVEGSQWQKGVNGRRESMSDGSFNVTIYRQVMD